MLTLKLTRNRTRSNFNFSVFNERKIIVKPLKSKFSDDEKQEVSTWRNILLRKVKIFIDNNFNPSKVNVIDRTKDKFHSATDCQKILVSIS